MKDIVFVKYNIIAKSGNHTIKELVAYATDEWEKIADRIIDQDLILSDNTENVIAKLAKGIHGIKKDYQLKLF